MNYQWYPGHMTKARRMMQEDIKLIDLVIELVDARVPFSSRNPDIDELAKNKSRLILLNKSDLADKAKTAHWVEYFQQKGFYVLELNAKTGAGNEGHRRRCEGSLPGKNRAGFETGIKNRPVRARWWESPMWENPPLLTAMRARPARRRETSPVSPRENSGFA